MNKDIPISIKKEFIMNNKNICANLCLDKCSNYHDCRICISNSMLTPCKAFGAIFKESMWDYNKKE